MGYRTIRVLNDHIFPPGWKGEEQIHQQVEIFTYVIEGSLEYEMVEGQKTFLSKGDVCFFIGGEGARRVLSNASQDSSLRYLEIWLLPHQKELTTSLEKLCLDQFESQEVNGLSCWRVTDQTKQSERPLIQDIDIRLCAMNSPEPLTLGLPHGRYVWCQVLKGKIMLEDYLLGEGDGASFTALDEVTIWESEEAEVLFIDLP